MSARMAIDALRSFLGGEMLQRADTGRGGLLIETAGLGLVGDILKRMPKDRADDVFLVSPENERCMGLLPSGSVDRLIAVLNALDPTLALTRLELEALKVFASHSPGSTAARAVDIRPANVKNRALALLLRLVEELNSPTWNCASEEPHALHELVERLLPLLLLLWSDPAAAALLFASPAADPGPQSLILVEPGMLEEESLPMLLALTLPMAPPEDTYLVIRSGPSAQALNRAAVVLQRESAFVAEVEEGGLALVPSASSPNGPLDRAWADARVNERHGELIRELSRLKHARHSDLVAAELSEEARGLVAEKALFQGDPRWVSEMLAICPFPARFAQRFIDRAPGKHTVAFDVIDLLAPLLAEVAERVLGKSGEDGLPYMERP